MAIQEKARLLDRGDRQPQEGHDYSTKWLQVSQAQELSLDEKAYDTSVQNKPYVLMRKMMRE